MLHHAAVLGAVKIHCVLFLGLGCIEAVVEIISDRNLAEHSGLGELEAELSGNVVIVRPVDLIEPDHLLHTVRRHGHADGGSGYIRVGLAVHLVCKMDHFLRVLHLDSHADGIYHLAEALGCRKQPEHPFVGNSADDAGKAYHSAVIQINKLRAGSVGHRGAGHCLTTQHIKTFSLLFGILRCLRSSHHGTIPPFLIVFSVLLFLSGFFLTIVDS